MGARLYSGLILRSSSPRTGSCRTHASRAPILPACPPAQPHACRPDCSTARLPDSPLPPSPPPLCPSPLPDLSTPPPCRRRLQRLFFLNEGQGLWEFLGSELGAVCYPPYTVTATRPAFRTRRQLLDYEAALAHADALTTAVMVGCAGVCVRVLLPDCEVVA